MRDSRSATMSIELSLLRVIPTVSNEGATQNSTDPPSKEKQTREEETSSNILYRDPVALRKRYRSQRSTESLRKALQWQTQNLGLLESPQQAQKTSAPMAKVLFIGTRAKSDGSDIAWSTIFKGKKIYPFYLPIG